MSIYQSAGGEGGMSLSAPSGGSKRGGGSSLAGAVDKFKALPPKTQYGSVLGALAAILVVYLLFSIHILLTLKFLLRLTDQLQQEKRSLIV